MTSRRFETAACGGISALIGAGVCLGFSPILVKAAATEAITVAVLRAGLATLMLVPLVGLELRRRGNPPARQLAFAIAAGIALGLDFSSWNISITEAGAGVASVLINIQVVIMPLLVLVIDGIRPAPATWVLAPVMLVGVGLAGGLTDTDAGTSPSAAGVAFGVIAGVGYTGYLYLIRRGTQGCHAWPLTVLATACGSAALTATVAGATAGTLEPPSTPRAWWLITLLALSSQVVAFALINKGVAQLTPQTSGVLLILPPVVALPLAAGFLAEVPSSTQILGCVIILLGAGYAALRSDPSASQQGLPEEVALEGERDVREH